MRPRGTKRRNEVVKIGELENCDHLFHHSCVMQWLGTDSSCPCCRRQAGALYGVSPENADILSETPICEIVQQNQASYVPSPRPVCSFCRDRRPHNHDVEMAHCHVCCQTFHGDCFRKHFSQCTSKHKKIDKFDESFAQQAEELQQGEERAARERVLAQAIERQKINGADRDRWSKMFAMRQLGRQRTDSCSSATLSEGSSCGSGYFSSSPGYFSSSPSSSGYRSGGSTPSPTGSFEPSWMSLARPSPQDNWRSWQAATERTPSPTPSPSARDRNSKRCTESLVDDQRPVTSVPDRGDQKHRKFEDQEPGRPRDDSLMALT